MSPQVYGDGRKYKMIRFAVIGTNWITDQFIEGASEIEDFSLVAVYSRTTERADQFAQKHNIKHIYTDIETMAKSDEIDAVYIASPNSFHAEQAIICMNNGKHVLCEKPIASNTKELKEMIVVAKKNNVLLMEALKSTLTPNFKLIQQNIHKIGRVRRFVANYCQYSSRYDAYLRGNILNAFKPEFSNGSLMDIGIYCLYPMIILFGKPNNIKANGIVLESGVDGEGSIILDYEDKEGIVLFSKITNSFLPSEIQGESGTMVIDKMNPPEKIEIHYRNGTVENISSKQNKNTMYYEVMEFIELIQANQVESILNSHQHSFLVSEIMEEARRQIGVCYPSDR
jgi:predicted dehydrogenase